jgi:predicted regulator of Ras-like GTPase activity (Roadblock/LC7/MglB family)
MLGFLKSLLRKSHDTAVASEQASAHESLPAAASPAPVRQSHGGNANAARHNPVRQNGKGVDVPLQKILEGLPLELQPRVVQPEVGELTISVPLEKVLAQLSRGAVKVSFGELRQAAPDIFTLENDRDRVLVALPLSEILARLNPALITRRRVQRQVAVPEDISSPFDRSGQGLADDENVAEPQPQPVPVAPARQNGVVPPIAAPPPGAVSRTVSSPVVPAHPISPVRATPPPAQAAPTPPIAMPAAPAPRFNVASNPPPAAPTHLPSAMPAPGPIAFTRTPLAATPAPVAPAASAATHSPRDLGHKLSPTHAPARSVPQPGKPASGPDPLVVSLTALAEAWPDAVRKEIIDANLVEAKVALPFNSVEQALKQGRIAFSWKSLRSWIKPAALPFGSTHDSTALELPLKVVAPLFLARQKQQAGAQQKVSVDEDIPNLFFGHPQPEGTPASAQATARPTDTNYYVWDENADTVKVHESELKRGPTPGTKFVAKYATPNEVVSRAASLDGVVGALIALPDGLMVANRLPPEVNADTLAAFLPQIFGKMSQCTKELRMGELNNLNFTVGNVPWKIFRVNAIFFAAFGRAGEPLPTAQLAALAAELDHKPK